MAQDFLHGIREKGFSEGMSPLYVTSLDSNVSELQQRLLGDFRHSEQTNMTKKNLIAFLGLIGVFVIVVIYAWVVGNSELEHEDGGGSPSHHNP